MLGAYAIFHLEPHYTLENSMMAHYGEWEREREQGSGGVLLPRGWLYCRSSASCREGARGTCSQCEVLPGVRGIAERGNVITQWRGQAANYSQLGIERRDQTHWKRRRLRLPGEAPPPPIIELPVRWKYEQQCGNPNKIIIVSDNGEQKDTCKQAYQW